MLHTDFSWDRSRSATPIELELRTRLTSRQNLYLAYLRGRISDATAAEDVLQDFNVKVISALDRAASIRNTDAWLARILRNSLFDYYRRGDARRRAEKAYADHVERVFDLIDDQAAQPEDDVAALEIALGGLRPDQAGLLRALHLEGRSREGLARDMGLEIGTLNVRALRARRALREKLERRTGASPERTGPGSETAAREDREAMA